MYADNAHLKRHNQRKTPCAPIIEKDDLPENKKGNPNRCKFCGRVYSRADSLKRHLKSCAIANTEEGMDALMDRALQKQNARLEERVDRLTALVEQLSGMLPVATQGTTISVGTVNTGPVTNVMQVNATIVTIKNFDSDDRICIPVSLVTAAFTENPRLVEYCRMTDVERTNADKAAPYVLEALIDLIRRAHKDPVYRNVHLNPHRSDQVMVCVGKDQRWEVRSLLDVTRNLFDGVANNLHRLILTDKERVQLPFNVQCAAAWVPNMYEDEPDRFVRDGRAPMAAHLQNTKPITA